MPSRYEQRKAERQRAARAVTPRPADAQRVDRRDERSLYEDRASRRRDAPFIATCGAAALHHRHDMPGVEHHVLQMVSRLALRTRLDGFACLDPVPHVSGGSTGLSIVELLNVDRRDPRTDDRADLDRDLHAREPSRLRSAVTTVRVSRASRTHVSAVPHKLASLRPRTIAASRGREHDEMDASLRPLGSAAQGTVDAACGAPCGTAVAAPTPVCGGLSA
jgi:hypothetical protein